MIEQVPSSSRTSATVLPDSLVDVYEQPETYTEAQTAEIYHEDTVNATRGMLDAAGKYNRWSVYDATDPSAPKAVFKRKSWPYAEPLQQGQQFYQELQQYQKQ